MKIQCHEVTDGDFDRDEFESDPNDLHGDFGEGERENDADDSDF
jgi:hypothetical protein